MPYIETVAEFRGFAVDGDEHVIQFQVDTPTLADIIEPLGECAKVTLRVTNLQPPPEPAHLHPDVQAVLKFFQYDHLPDRLAYVSKPFCDLAHSLANDTTLGPEVVVALRKLLEGKDAAVRAAL